MVVLIYHRVGGGTDSAVDLPVAQFRAQLAHLAAHHRVWALDDAVAALARGDQPEGVVITFDDGTADVVDHAMPELSAAGLPATLYLVTSAPDRGILPWGAPAASWAGLRDAATAGLDVQSHTHDHLLLDRVSAAEAADQLDRSIAAIEQHLGTTPRHLAAPKAVRPGDAARAEVAARFTSCALAGHRVNRAPDDLQRLGRVPVRRDDRLPEFAAKARGGLRLEGAARDLAARVRYRGRRT